MMGNIQVKLVLHERSVQVALHNRGRLGQDTVTHIL